MTRKYTRSVDKMPNQLQVAILSRKMSPEAMKELYATYQEARLKTPSIQEPSAKEIRLASLVRTEGYKGAAEKVGVGVEKVYSAVNRVSRYNFFSTPTK